MIISGIHFKHVKKIKFCFSFRLTSFIILSDFDCEKR